MNVDNTGLFLGEQPAPITVSNPKKSSGQRKTSSKGRKRSVSAKKGNIGTGGGGKTTYDQN